MKLAGKLIVISGGSGGIGTALVQKLHDAGAIIYSIDIKPPKSVIKDVHYLEIDLTESHQLSQSIKEIQNQVDIVIFNTGIMRRGTIFESTEEDYDLLFDANLKASWLLIKHLEPKLRKETVIVQIASGHALNPEPDPGLYTLTKKAVVAFAEMIALTRPNYDVRIVYPGPVLTELLLSRRSMADRERIEKIAHKPEFLADKIIEFLKSSHKSLKFNSSSWDYHLE